LNKPDLVEILVERHELTRAFARELVDDVLGSITDAAQRGEECPSWLRQVQGH
jgi:DNA-binding protein HU-beta